MYDVTIIGAGPAGITAGIFSARRDLKTLILEDPGSLPTATEAIWVDDYPGIPNIRGQELMKKMREHSKRFKIDSVMEKALDIRKKGKVFAVKTDKAVHETRTLIIATGAMHRKTSVPGEEKFSGKGVSYCASCDGPLFKGKDVLVVGGGDSAVSYAILLDQIGSRTTLIHRRDELRAVEAYRDQIKKSGVKIIWNTTLKEIRGDTMVKSVVVEDVKTSKGTELPMDGVFIAIGSVPTTELAKNIKAKVDKAGFITVDKEQKTSVPGVFAAGDCCNNPTKRIVTACADGSKAAESAYMYVKEKFD